MRQEENYRPVSIVGVFALVATIFGLVGLALLPFAVLGGLGLILGVLAMIGASRSDHAGAPLWYAAIGFGAASVVAAPLLQASRYQSEALPGYDRVDFDIETIDGWVGRPICLKGYVLQPYAGGRPHLLFSPDGDHRTQDAIRLKLSESVEPSNGAFACSGVLHVDESSPDSVGRYEFVVDKVTRATTRFRLKDRVAGDGC